MHAGRICLVASVWGVLGFNLLAGGTETEVRYSLLDIGDCRVFGLNNLGQVVGSYVDPLGQTRAFRTAPNQPLNPLTDDLNVSSGTVAQAANDLGETAGRRTGLGNAWCTPPTGAAGPARDLGGLGGTFSYAYGINDLGQVVGMATRQNGEKCAFRTAPGTAINPLTDILVGGGSTARDINHAGYTTGYFPFPDSRTDVNPDGMHAFRIAPGRAINYALDDLGAMGLHASYGYGINNNGQVVGYAIDRDGQDRRAFRTAPFSPINAATDDLGTLGGSAAMAYGINDGGSVVGWSRTASGSSPHAFVVQGAGPMRDLNLLVDSLPGGWTLESAFGINNHGQICGQALVEGQYRSFLLTPVPEPGTLALVLGTAGLLAYRRQRGRYLRDGRTRGHGDTVP